MKTSQVLRRADALFETHELCKHYLAMGRTGWPAAPEDIGVTHFCISGAILKVSHEHWIYAMRRVRTCLGLKFVDNVVGWNNKPETTKADVRAILIQGAELAEAEGE